MNIKMNITNLLIAILLFGSIQITNSAASGNRINKVITVMKDEILEESNAPKLIMVLLDELEEGDIFYLNLGGAKWVNSPERINLAGNDNEVYLELKQMTASQLQVRVKRGTIKAGSSLSIPMTVRVTADKAYVTVSNNNTAVTSGTYLIAESMSFLGTVTIGKIPVTTGSGNMADLWVEEPFSQAFSKAIAKGEEPVVQIQLNHNGYVFDLNSSQPRLNGIKGFEGINAEDKFIRQIDEQTLEFSLPDIKEAKYTGGFILSGICIRNVDKIPALGKITATVKSDLLETVTLEILEVADYEIELVTSPKTVYAGSKQSILFSLQEKVSHSLTYTRPTYVTFDRDIYLESSKEGKIPIKLNGEIVECDPITENRKVIGFEIEKLPESVLSYKIEVDVVIPGSIEGVVTVLAEGRSLIESLEGEVLNIIKPCEIEVKPFDAKVGIKDQVGGSITLTEVGAGAVLQGENIVIKLEESAIKFTKVPNLTVIKGDIRLGTPAITDNSIEIPVIRRSNTASTIMISDFMLTADRTVANGTYSAQIGGKALSRLADTNSLDPLWEVDFIIVGKNSIIPDNPSEKIQRVCFTIGKNTYSVGSTVKTMDAIPYISGGRTLIPIRYVADALGISPGLVSWDNQSKTVTIRASEIVILKMGSQIMKVGGKAYSMSATPVINNGRTFVPVAEISRALNIQTLWDGTTKVVTFLNYL